MSTGSMKNLLYNLSLLSAEMEEYIFVERKHNPREPLCIRPTIHITQITPFGELKTTTIHAMQDYLKLVRPEHPYFKVSAATAPAIAGSINKKGEIIHPLNTKVLNGTMFIDEFKTGNNEKSEAIGCVLDILESEYTSRVTARLPTEGIESPKGAKIQYFVKDGRIYFEGLRSNWMFFTGKNLNMNRELSMAMLISRTIPVRFMPTWDEMDAIDDNPDNLFKGLDLKLPEMRVITNAEYMPMREFTRKKLESLNIPKNYYFRTVDDLVRCYYLMGFKYDWKLFEYILDNKIQFAQGHAEEIYKAEILSQPWVY